MSVYDGTRLEKSYAHGFDVGRDAARRDLRDRAPVDGIAEDHRVRASVAVYAAPLGDAIRSEAAYLVGFARGYREEIR